MTIYEAIALALTEYTGQLVELGDMQVIASREGHDAPFAVQLTWQDEDEGFLVPIERENPGGVYGGGWICPDVDNISEVTFRTSPFQLSHTN